MTKAEFIQQIIIRTCPGKEKIQPAIAHGESLWDELTKAGYGDKKPTKPKQSRGLKDDAYTRLNHRQKAFFDKFWDAFDYKAGKNEAAQRWAELGDPTDDGYQKIIAAAIKEARRDRGEQSRKHAQGWLGDLRWMDYDTAGGKQDNREFMRLNSELNGLKQLQASCPSDSLKASIEKIETQMAGLRGKKVSDGTAAPL